MEVHGRRAESDKGNSSVDADIFCQHCEFESVTTTANGICFECEEYMCKPCFQNHLKAKLCRHHGLVDIDKASVSIGKSKENEEKCKRHENEAVKFYCREHDSVGCGDCIILEHSTCKPEYIKDLSKEFQENEQLISLIRKLEQLEYTNQEKLEEIQHNRKVCNEIQEDALNEIRRFRVDVNKYLDKAEAYIINETKQLKLDNNIHLDKRQGDCERLLSKIETLKNKLDTHNHRENALFIHVVNCKPVVKDIEQGVADLLSEKKIKLFKFVPDEQLVKVITSARKFGSWNISEINDESVMSVKEKDKSMVPKHISHTETTKRGPAEVYVGARVRLSKETRISLSRRQPGTVTGIHSDDKVDVMWDATGMAYPYTTGPGGPLKFI